MDSETSKKLVDSLDAFYEIENISRAIMVCADDDAAVKMSGILRERDHAVTLIISDMAHDDRPLYGPFLNDFSTGTSRLLVVSYQAWEALKDEIEVNVLPHQNLIIFCKMDDDIISYVTRQLQDSIMRGFVNQDTVTHVLYLDVENEKENIEVN